MSVRLLALVMLPVTAMTALAGTVVLSSRESADAAVAVDHGVEKLATLVDLRDAIHSEQSVVAFTARFFQLGVSPDEAAVYLNVDLDLDVTPLRATAIDAVRELGTASPITEAALIATYARLDRQPLGSPTAGAELGVLGDRLQAAALRDLERLERTAGEEDLVVTLEALRLGSALVEVSTPLVIDLTAVWFPSPSDSTADTANAMARLSVLHDAHHDSVAELRALDVPSVLAVLDRIEANATVEAFTNAVDATLAGVAFSEDGVPIDESLVTTSLRGRILLGDLLDDLVDEAIRAVHDVAAPLAEHERLVYLQWTFGTAAVALASVAVALRLARSIARPLRELASYAHAVNEGHLHAEPVARRAHGPRETELVLGVFTELVENLQLLDAKTNALAQVDFDDPSLRAPLPGRIGRSLDKSVALLSGSIVERDEMQTHLAHEATHDSLTGIANRPAAIAGVAAAASRAARTGAEAAILFIDLNEFKGINDSHGHEVGDAVLREVATRLAGCVRGADLAARLGGNEFVIVAESVGSVTHARDLAKRVISAVTQPIEVGILHVRVGAAIGIAMALDAPEDPLMLLGRADAAMYQAKHHGRSSIEVFDDDLELHILERQDIEAALTVALHDPDGGGLHLLYQPIVDARTGVLTGAEALVRWDRPGRGRLTPDAFIPIAEATPLIIDLDRWVLAAAGRELVAWLSTTALADIPMSVNISGRHLLSRQLPGHIRELLEDTHIDPRRLRIEITETVLLDDLAGAAEELDAVRALGVQVAIDDFGTGYTSVAHLEELPIDAIKIDRSFIGQLGRRPGADSLARMVTEFGHANDLCIVAEGVETRSELQAVQLMGADHVQGYLFSRPLEPAALETWALGRGSGSRRPRPSGELSVV